MSPQISPKELAEILIARIGHSCYEETRSVYSYIECVANHSANKLRDFVGEYTIDGKDLRETIENADEKFLESFKKEYEDLWKEYLATTIVERLIDLLEAGQTRIVENDNLTDDEKTHQIEKYKDVLDRLGGAIAKAIDTQEPLSSDELKRYLLELYEIAGFGYNHPNDPVDHYMNYYDLLDKTGKLKLLELFLDGIANVFLCDAETTYWRNSI